MPSVTRFAAQCKMWLLLAIALAICFPGSKAFRYDERYVDYNLNTNQNAIHPLDYAGEWEGHDFTPSPKNWRFPFYTLFLDRFVNGDPTNDNINGTVFEHDLTSNQMRNGGDLQGLIDTLDYLQGMGIKVRTVHEALPRHTTSTCRHFSAACTT